MLRATPPLVGWAAPLVPHIGVPDFLASGAAGATSHGALTGGHEALRFSAAGATSTWVDPHEGGAAVDYLGTGVRFVASRADETAPTSTPAAHQLWWLGMLLALAASFVGALGDNLVRYAHRERYSEYGELEPLGACWRNFLWAVGILCTAAGNTALTLWALAYADVSLVVPFAGAHVAFGVLLARCMNHERLSWTAWGGVGIVVVGILCTVTAGNKDTVDYPLEHMIELFGGLPFIGITSFFAMVALICIAGVCLGSRLQLRPGIQCLAASMLCGILGGFGSVFAKTAVEVLKALRQDPGTVSAHPWCYGILAIALSLALAQLIAWNSSLKNFEAARVTPIILATLTVVGTSVGVIYFEEYRRFSRATTILLPIGIVVTVFGIIVLTYSADADDECCNSTVDDGDGAGDPLRAGLLAGEKTGDPERGAADRATFLSI